MLPLLLTLSALAGVPEDTASAVALHRDALVLAASVPTLSPGQQRDVPILGKFLLSERLDTLRSLDAALTRDVPRSKADKARILSAFLDHIEGDELRDGDKLVFREALATLERELAAAPAGKRRDALLARVKQDRAAIDTVQQRYRDEMAALMGTLRTRGMTLTREAWDSYIAAISADRDVAQVFARYAIELSSNTGASRASGDNDLQIFGTTLPDKTFVLTYDDGPHDVHTQTILDELARRDVKGVFFEVAQNVGTYGDEGLVETAAARHTRRIVADGHLLASHTWSHKNLPRQTDANIEQQLDLADRVLDEVSGTDVVLVRPPFGATDGRVFNALKERNTRAYLWNVDSMDWADPIPESIAQTVYEQVTAQGHGVILLHDVHEQTAKATPLILDLLEKDGYKLVLWDGESIFGDARGGEAKAVESKTPEQQAGLYADSWAVVIGINDYAEWPRLAYAVHDAQGVTNKLKERFGFQDERIITLLDGEATRENILRVLGDDLPAKLGEDDRVFVFYAGHGATRPLPGGSERGYIIPVDAGMDNLASSAISMSQLQDVQEAMRAKHVLFVMDACYSGIALTRSGGYTGDPRRYLQEVTRRNARQILTAGGSDEQVSDHGPGGHSIFTWTVLQGMDGPADLNGDGFITATELSGFVAPRVSSLSKQTPAFGNLVGSAGGEFVLTLDPDEALLSDLSTGRADADALARAKALLASENEELMAQLAAMQAELSKLKGASRGDPDEDPKIGAKRLHEHGLRKFREGEIAEAYEAIKQAAQLDSSNVEIVNNLGYVLQQLGEHDKAIPHFERSIELDPERAVAWLNLGDSQAALGRTDDAKKTYGHYLQMMPESPVKKRLEAYRAR